MVSEYAHVSDEELVQFVDGELAPGIASRVESHLAGCWDCRSRMRQLEATIADFVDVHHHSLDPQLPSREGPRAMLRARMAQQMATAGHSSRLQRLRRAFAGRRLIYVGAMILLVVLGTTTVHHVIAVSESKTVGVASTTGPVPDPRLTPGFARPVSTSEVCAVRYSDDTRVVPASVRRRVFQEYRLTGRQLQGYELDYLISPQLGGTDDIRNLWPEPEAVTGWNMRVKDALEDRLHQLVCQGTINLSTAQRDLATDWISAYKRYFHTDRPIQSM
jgi:hypothetical protein